MVERKSDTFDVTGSNPVSYKKRRALICRCGGMVDTLVLGTSAKAWEFESLHAQFNRRLDLLRNISKGFFMS